jgi:hypothetical protein
MKRRRRVLAISVVSLVVAAVLVSMVIGAVREPITGGGVVFTLGTLSLLATGAFLVLRVPENRLSWVLLLVALGDGLINAADGAEMGSLIEIIGATALFALVLPGLGVFVPLWFPNGQALSPRWRWLSWAATLGVVGIVGGWALMALEGQGTDLEECVSLGSCASIVGLLVVLAAVVGAVVSLILRWMRSRGAERLQLRWLVPAYVVFLVGVIAEFGGFQYSLVANVVLPVGFVVIPVAIGIAVTRYRLYEIDRVLSRTITYAIVIALLATVYFVGLAALTTLLSTDSPLAVAGSTLAAAALFNPVRKRVQGWVDRHFNRSRYDAQRVVDSFSDSLRRDLDQDHLVGGWMGVVAETMHPSAAGVWIKK